MRHTPVIVDVGEVAGRGVAQAGAGPGPGWKMAEAEDSIGTEGIGRVLAGTGPGRVMVIATGMGSIVVDCSVVEGYIAAVWKQHRLAADLAAVVEEAVEYRNAARDAQPDKQASSSFRWSF